MPVYAREAACSDPGGRREPHAYHRASRHDNPRAPELNEACSAGVGHEGWGEGATRVQRRAFAPKREILSSTFRAPSTPQIPEASPAHFLTKYHPPPHSRPTPSPAHNPIPTQPPSNIDTHTLAAPATPPTESTPNPPLPQHPFPHPPPHYPTTTQRTRHTDPR